MSVIERVLNRLEEKLLVRSAEVTGRLSGLHWPLPFIIRRVAGGNQHPGPAQKQHDEDGQWDCRKKCLVQLPEGLNSSCFR